MRIVFMGTPDFAVPSLAKLIQSEYEVVAVFTQPDKPKGRGHKLQMSPVKELALQAGIPVYQPVSLKDGQAVDLVKGLQPDMIVVAAYGKILPKEILQAPAYGCINVHGSLLPKYRGAAPIQHAILHGEKTSGITIMFMEEGLDTGAMLMKEEISIGDDETSGELFDRLKTVGAELLLRAIPRIVDGSLQPVKQVEEEASYAPMISKEMACIDWSRPAEEIRNRIRAMNPWPCAFSSLSGKKIKIYAASLLERSGEPGLLFVENGELCVYCGIGALLLSEIQPENGKRMTGKSYLLGHPIKEKIYFQ